MMNLWLNRLAIVTMALTLMPIMVFAADCEDIRLDLPGSAFDKMPIYNQLDTRGVDAKICYAIASAQLVDEYRHRKGDSLDQITSPMSLALGYKEFDKGRLSTIYKKETMSMKDIIGSVVGGGMIQETIAVIDQFEICDQRAVDEAAGLFAADSAAKKNRQSLQQFVEGVLIGETGPKILSFSKLDYLVAVKKEFTNICRGNTFTLEKMSQESLEVAGYLDDLEKILNLRFDDSLSDEQMQNRHHEFSLKYNKTKMIQDYQNKINQALAQGIPVGVGFFSKALQYKMQSDDLAAHAAVITGQRKNPATGVCEMLVRDSTGSSCKDDRGQDRYTLPCENGSVWVPTNSLLSETLKINWIP